MPLADTGVVFTCNELTEHPKVPLVVGLDGVPFLAR
jgi:hypothetical protein